MGELSSVDNDLDRIWIDPHSGDTSPFVPEDPGVNPISRALEKAGMRNWLRSDSRFWILLSFIEEEADPETRAEMARQLSEVFDVGGEEA